MSKTKTTKSKNSGNEVSAFAKFWFTFLGYHFLEIETGKIRTKLQVFYADKDAARVMVFTKVVSFKYNLVDSFGWKNGTRLNN